MAAIICSVVWLVFCNTLIAAAFGAGVVTFVLGFNAIAFAAWIATLIWSARRQNGKFAIVSVVTQLTTMVLVIIAAVSAPVKTTDRFLDQTINVPSSSMTLEEIGGDPNAPPPEWRPFRIHVTVPPDETSKQVDFPSTTMTLRQFVGALESQTTLRHRFAHCGNGSTILWGGDCSFGLHLRRPLEQ